MTPITLSNGEKCEFDETLKVGDLITTPNAGFYEIVDIKDNAYRPAEGPVFYYKMVFTGNGQRRRSKTIDYRDAIWCHRVTEKIVRERISKHTKAIENLEKLLTSL